MSSDSTSVLAPIDRDALLELIENLDDVALILLDSKGSVRSWNRGAQQLKGYEAAEVLGASFELFYPPEALVLDHPQRELEAAAATGSYEEEGWRVRKDGSRFWAHVRIVALTTADGSLRGFGKITRDLTERRQAADQQANVLALLKATARTDALTGLPNRRAWDDTLEREMARARRTGSPLAIGVIDLDHFKQVNDALGHRGGDRFLRQCATAWRATLRADDVMARYGGDEFAVCLPDCTESSALFVLARMRAATPGDHSCSVGLAVWDLVESSDELFGRADHAMYRAKGAGRDRLIAAIGQGS